MHGEDVHIRLNLYDTNNNHHAHSHTDTHKRTDTHIHTNINKTLARDKDRQNLV